MMATHALYPGNALFLGNLNVIIAISKIVAA
jgi:hypothetical protein